MPRAVYGKVMKKFLCLLFAMSFVGATCNNGPAPAPAPPHPEDAPSCAAACKRMQDLGCREGDDMPGPNHTVVTCEVFCQKTIEDNNVALNPSCIAGITSCKQIETTCAIGKRR
jgi:hypothetical protein